MPEEKKSYVSFFLLLGVAALMLGAIVLREPQMQSQPLWPQGAPGAVADTAEDKPSLRVFLPPVYNNSGTAVVICPGGGYRILTIGYEGEAIARWFNTIGVAAFVLEYRHAPSYQHPTPLQDALRAMRYVRYHAKDYRIEPGLIGIMGFSAGGHLASSVSTHYNEATLNPSDPVDGVSSRPDFTVLGYPIISLLPPVTHEGTALNLMGNQDTPELRTAYSNHLHVTSQTPPAFLFHTLEDEAVPAENSILYYKALVAAHVPAEMHLYEKGKHGAGLADGRDGAPHIPTLTTWPDLLMRWLAGRGFLGRSNTAAP